MTDWEVLPGCARVRTKCAEKTSVDLWGQSRDPRELPGVTAAGSEGRGVTIGIRADPRGYGRVRVSVRACGTCGGTGRIGGCQEGTFLDCRWTDEVVGLLSGEGCDILALGSIGLI